jgi:hypothetical protein
MIPDAPSPGPDDRQGSGLGPGSCRVRFAHDRSAGTRRPRASWSVAAGAAGAVCTSRPGMVNSFVRRVAAVARRMPASAPTARPRLCAVTAGASQAALAMNRPDARRCGRARGRRRCRRLGPCSRGRARPPAWDVDSQCAAPQPRPVPDDGPPSSSVCPGAAAAGGSDPPARAGLPRRAHAIAGSTAGVVGLGASRRSGGRDGGCSPVRGDAGLVAGSAECGRPAGWARRSLSGAASGGSRLCRCGRRADVDIVRMWTPCGCG